MGAATALLVYKLWVNLEYCIHIFPDTPFSKTGFHDKIRE